MLGLGSYRLDDHAVDLGCRVGVHATQNGDLDREWTSTQAPTQLYPTVSQHLALLRKDGLVSTRREGQTIWYSLVSEPIRRVVETLYDIYCGPQAISEPKASPKRARRKTS